MSKISKLSFFILLTLSFLACEQSNPNFQKDAQKADYLHRSMQQLTDVIVHDIFSPPVASRIYAYPSIAAYEILSQEQADYNTMVGQLTDLADFPSPNPELEYCHPIAASHAFLEIGKALIFSEQKIVDFQAEIQQEWLALNMPDAVYQRSLEYGKQVAGHILAWANEDNYKETRTFPKYSISEKPEEWKPTPPDYMDGIEPHWNKIRPFVIKSAEQFTPPPPTPFDMDKKSKFYQELMEVYTAIEAEDKEDRVAIASFWDCNPYVSHHTGHVKYATKKITPGGHWIGITALVAKQKNLNLMQTSEAYARVAIGLADGFISCWDEKYRSNLIRPETVINEYVDENWLPVLQTPPFPEYTSGHSVISRSAAVILTDLLGDNFSFDDTVEEQYGLPTRSFNSFLEASEEAAISRLYGGIHYRPAIDYGVSQGDQVGKYIVANLETNKKK